MSNLATFITEGKVSVIRDFLVEFLKVAFFLRIEPEEALFGTSGCKGDCDVCEKTRRCPRVSKVIAVCN